MSRAHARASARLVLCILRAPPPSLADALCAPGRLSVRRMKAIFKRWLDFELKHGSDQQADHVRQSAREYVQSIGSA